MNKALFNALSSPYQTLFVKRSRYRRILHLFFALIVILPALFIIVHSFTVYFVTQVVIFILFPIFIWVYLNTDDITDLKLDVIKVFVTIILYSAYLMALAWVMILTFKPTLRVEYMLINFGYIFLLLIIATIVSGSALYHRYVQHFIHNRAK